MRLLVPVLIVMALLGGAVILDRPQPRADVVFVNRGELHTLDPQRMSWLQDFRIANATLEGLVRWNNETFDIIPGVAERWDVSPDGLTYTFHLRTDARWSNGDPVTAGDFVYSWKRALYPDTAADYADMFFKIRGGEDFFNWRAAQLEAYVARFDDDTRDPDEPVAAGDSAARQAIVETMHAEAEQRFADTVGLRAEDDHTLIVELALPTSYMLDLFAFGVFFPVHPPTVRQYATLDWRSGSIRQQFGWTKPPISVTNGPYMITLWRYKRDLRMERNPHYWGQSLIRSDAVSSIAVEDPSTSALAFETGTIDWLSDMGAEYRADMLNQARRYRLNHVDRLAWLLRHTVDLENDGVSPDEIRAKLRSMPPPAGTVPAMDREATLRACESMPQWMRYYDEVLAIISIETPPGSGERNDIHAFSAYGTYFYNFNCSETLNDGSFNPFKSAEVRRAFTMALDKSAIVKHVTRMNQKVATTFIPPGSIPGYASPKGVSFDPRAARALMSSQGWDDRDGNGVIENEAGDEFPVVEILYSTGQGHEDIAQAAGAMWERELRVRTTLVGKESKVFGEEVKNHNFMVSRANWFGDYGDPTTFLDLFRSTNNNNDRNYANPTFDALMRDVDRELDPEKRMRLLEQAEAFIVDDQLPLAPVFHRVTVYMYDPVRLHGISQHPRLTQYLWELEMIDP